ncbi:hypothetical protein DBR11_19435 [Pedobacter sp. HMWF019]|uniref:hypothetical protein n=1 Tax=Pedobacter sp. HMWF019 TaxID=2056856 RepID=UPI000D333FA7|nr:hypothetical protein [Pedobacter sp. HMWF019]PTS96277.1 hypothetical protein DBR11_19435 [Pedobacter sp. HMWF019]
MLVAHNDPDIQKRIEADLHETMEDFFHMNAPSDCLETLNELICCFIAAHENENFAQAHIQNTIFGANIMGVFITKIHELYNKKTHCSRITKSSTDENK